MEDPSLTLEASRKGAVGGGSNGPLERLDFFYLKSEHLDQLSKVLAQLFLDNKYMFCYYLNDVSLMTSS